MILLDSHNRIIEECLNDAINHAQTFGSIKKGTDILFADFDDVLYHISAMKSKYGLQISIRIPFFSDLAKYNVTENLKEIYHDMVAAEAESGYSVSLIVDYRVLLQFDKKDLANYIRNVSRLKRNTFGVILNQMFIRRQDKLELNESQEMNVLQFRSGEKLYVQVLSDKVLVIFSTTFKDPEDAVIYKVFLQELRVGRKNIQGAPQLFVSYHDPPLELKTEICDDDRSFITFVLLPSHIDQKSCEKTIDILLNFRNYLQYHIKCTKAFIHSRIRCKIEEFTSKIQQSKLNSNDCSISRTNLKGFWPASTKASRRR